MTRAPMADDDDDDDDETAAGLEREPAKAPALAAGQGTCKGSFSRIRLPGEGT